LPQPTCRGRYHEDDEHDEPGYEASASSHPIPRWREMSLKTTELARLLAWSIAALSLILAVTGLALSLWVLARGAGQWSLAPHLWFAPATSVTYALVGALVTARHPRNPIGWIMSTVGVLSALTLLAADDLLERLSREMDLPGLDIARWLNLWIWIPTTLLPLTFLLLLFPDGRLPSARWRPISWSAGLGLAAFVAGTALHPSPPVEPSPTRNPFGIPAAAGALDLLVEYIVWPFIMVGIFGALAALVVRFRRARGPARAIEVAGVWRRDGDPRPHRNECLGRLPAE
jgi:hypothetical protein